MTRTRARKSDIRKAMNPGEAYNAAALRLHNAEAAPASAPLKRIITAYLYQGSFPHKLHALIDHPATRERMDVGNLVIPGVALCGNRGGSIDYGGWRLVAAPGDTFSQHSGVDFNPEDTGYCQECVTAWRAQFQPDSPESKSCSSCEQDRPLNKFRPHKGRKDGLASECEDCRRAAKEAAAKAKEAEDHQRWMSSRRATAQGWVDRVKGWQETPGLMQFRCSAGHTLVATVGEKGTQVWLNWGCPCGISYIPRATLKLIEGLDLAKEEAGANPFLTAIA